MKNSGGDEILSLNKVHTFKVDFASLEPTATIFPQDARIITFNPSSKFKNYELNLDKSFSSRFSFLTRIELSDMKLFANLSVKNLEVVILRNCTIASVESIIELSEKLQTVQLIDCQCDGPSIRFPKRDHLRELVLQTSATGSQKYNFYLSSLQDIMLSTLHIDSLIYKPEELHFLEDMSSLESLRLFCNEKELMSNFKIEKLIRLKTLILTSNTNSNYVIGPMSNLFVNPRILEQALIIVPPAATIQIYPFKPTQSEIETVIYSVMPQVITQIHFYLYNENFIYLVLSQSDTQKERLAYMLLEHQPPYNILSCKILKNQPSNFRYLYYQNQTRTIYPKEKSKYSSKCLTM